MRRLLFKLVAIVLGILWIWTLVISFQANHNSSLSSLDETVLFGSLLSSAEGRKSSKDGGGIKREIGTGATNKHDPSLHSAGSQGDSKDYPFEFAACLLTKDDKIILPEWLAYHYTVMPLRRLIVAIDPLSITSPEEILEVWRNRTNLQITIWTGNWYWKISKWQDPATLNKMPPKGDKIIVDTKRSRQSSFYTNCLQLLKMEGYSWTTIIDTDEYFTYNSIMPVEVMDNKTIQDGILSAESRKKLPKFIGRQNETIAHWIHQHGIKEAVISRKSLCIIYPRLQFFSKVVENKQEELDSSSSLLSPFGTHTKGKTIPRFDLEAFHTLQYSSHDLFDRSFKGRKPLPGKSLVNAALVQDDYKVKNPHAPFTFKCKGDVHNQVTEGWPFRVHQYSGSLKVWLSRPERTKEMWEQRNRREHANHLDYSLTRWFPEFVRLLKASLEQTQLGAVDDDALNLAYQLTQKAHDDAYNETMDIFRRLTLNETVPPLYKWDKPIGDKHKASHLIQFLPNGSSAK